MSKELNKAPVEQAGEDERVIGWRERILAAHPNSDPGFWPDALLVEHMAAEIADLRAALAQPSPAQAEGAPVVGCLCGMPMTEGHHSPDGCCNLEEFEPQAQAEQAEGFTHFPELMESVKQMDAMLKAEAERPEVVAYRTVGRHAKHQRPHFALNYYKQNAEDQAAHWRERGCDVSEEELMTVAQHERIVEARWNRAMDLMGEHVARISEKFKAEREAALAEVERLDRAAAPGKEGL